MKNYSHIDKSAFRHGEYIAYCNGAQRVTPFDRSWRMNGKTFDTLAEVNAYCQANNGKPTN